jgi:hypothetical protein
MDFQAQIAERYFDAYKELIALESIGDDSVAVSFPFHFSGDHRIELTVTRVSGDMLVISDSARTLSELRNSGLRIGSKIRMRVQKLARLSGLRIVGDHLLLDSDLNNVGANIQRLLEATKTIGDVYLVHHSGVVRERFIFEQVRDLLNRHKTMYTIREKIHGQIETHKVDFLVPPNGKPGLALTILPISDPRLIAEAWGFKCGDIRAANPKMRIGLVYDTESARWTNESKAILEQRADIAVSSEQLHSLESRL